MFGPNPDDASRQPVFIVGVGYEPLNILEVVDERHYAADKVRFLLPFPSRPPGLEKNWRFLLHIEQQLTRLEPASILRVHPHNVPSAFDEIVAQTNNGTNTAVLAPFGPKPFSVAMALFGYCKRLKNQDVEIGYTQPKMYCPDYSSGVEMEAGEPRIIAYCVRAGGRDLYTLD
jgi:hypothetical protein